MLRVAVPQGFGRGQAKFRKNRQKNGGRCQEADWMNMKNMKIIDTDASFLRKNANFGAWPRRTSVKESTMRRRSDDRWLRLESCT